MTALPCGSSPIELRPARFAIAARPDPAAAISHNKQIAAMVSGLSFVRRFIPTIDVEHT
jgi:hypothetical protein